MSVVGLSEARLHILYWQADLHSQAKQCIALAQTQLVQIIEGEVDPVELTYTLANEVIVKKTGKPHSQTLSLNLETVI